MVTFVSFRLSQVLLPPGASARWPKCRHLSKPSGRRDLQVSRFKEGVLLARKLRLRSLRRDDLVFARWVLDYNLKFEATQAGSHARNYERVET